MTVGKYFSSNPNDSNADRNLAIASVNNNIYDLVKEVEALKLQINRLNSTLINICNKIR